MMSQHETTRQRKNTHPQGQRSPGRLPTVLLKLTGVIFATGFAVMEALTLLPLEGTWEHLADSLMLAILLLPGLYYFGVRSRSGPLPSVGKSAGKDFRLARYALLVSSCAIVGVLLMVGFGLRGILHKNVLEESMRDAQHITALLRATEFETFIQAELAGHERGGFDPQRFDEVDRWIRDFLPPLGVPKIKVFDRDTRIIYSTDPTIVGRLNRGNANLAAALGGGVVSELEHQDPAKALPDGPHLIADLAETYLPILGAGGQVVGSFEVSKEVTSRLQEARRSLALVMIVLFLALMMALSILGMMMHRAAMPVWARTTALRQIEWLLTRGGESDARGSDLYSPPEGNLVDLNRCQALRSAVGDELLTDIVSDYLDLLETSAAVCEENGDYALSLLTSGWCRTLDAASRKLCGPVDDREALECGKWLCHESCWTDSSKVAMETGRPVDIECHGGIRLYAVPIRAGEHIVGSINFGYGDPPRDPHKVGEISDRYGVDAERLMRQAQSYESRPRYIIEIAKKRLSASARMIGALVGRAQAEAELRTAKTQAEKARREVEQVNAQLLQSDKMASIGQLAAGVAHEINNPIGFISSNLNSLGEYAQDLQRVLASYDELLQLCLVHPDLKTKGEEIIKVKEHSDVEFILSDLGNLIKESVDGAKRVRDIVADLRDFSHVDSPDAGDVEVNELMDKTINVAWNELKYKTEVVREYGELPTISGFGGKLGQVFLNLLVNAAHAIKERGTITVRTGHTGGYIWIEVADTGCGIPKENIDHVFNAFFTTKEAGKGTGLGLHLAKNIVDAHGGFIDCKSTVGEGTTFHVELPVSGPPSAAVAIQEESA